MDNPFFGFKCSINISSSIIITIRVVRRSAPIYVKILIKSPPCIIWGKVSSKPVSTTEVMFVGYRDRAIESEKMFTSDVGHKAVCV